MPPSARPIFPTCRPSTAIPDDSGTIEDAFNNLLTALQGLSTSPDSQSARIGVVNAAQSMAQQLNATTAGIQSLRANAETGINESVNTANTALKQIAAINNQLQASGQTDAATAALLDQRDQYIDQVSRADGRSRRHQRPEPGDAVHQFRRAAGRNRGCDVVVQSAGNDDAEHALQYRSDQEQCRHHLDQFPARRQLRPGVDQVDPLRQDRRLSRDARQHTGAGAGPDRPVRRDAWRARCRTRPPAV